MTARLYKLGRFCVRRARWVVSAWVLAAAAVVILAGSLGTQYADDLTLPGQDSQQATDLLDAKFPDQANGTIPVVFEVERGKVTGSSNRQAIDELVKRLRGERGVDSVVSPLSQAGSAQVGKGGTIAYASMTLEQGPGELSDEDAQRIVDAAHESDSQGLDLAVGGYLGQQVSKPATESSEVVGLAAAVIVLVLTFGSVVAMGMPIVTALIGLAIGLSLIGVGSHAITIPTIGPTLATMIGLGVGIDYALFIVTRHRAGLHRGLDPGESAARAAATAGGAVVFAGSTVVVALLSLGLAGIPLVRALGYTAAVAVVVAILAAVTLLPALLAMLGRRVESLRVPLPHSTAEDGKAHGWEAWARGVAAHPVPAMVVSVAVLLALAIPVTNLHLGQEDDGALPDSTDTGKAYHLTTEGFGVGQNGPLLIAVELGEGGPQSLQPLGKAISSDPGIAGVSPFDVNGAEDAAIANAIPTTAPSAFATQDTIDRLRDQVIPKAVAGNGDRVHVGGTTAGYVDLGDEIGDSLPQVIGLVVILSFLVLMLAFRSLVVPLQAAMMNLLSIGAAYGLVTLVFQEGHGASLIGLDGSVPVVSFLPLVMFAILFGLSMDYEVFLLTQVKEANRAGKDTRAAVIAGLASSGRVITSAALIMVSVFFSFVLNDDPVVKQFGVGLAFAVAIDATVVRCLLVPSVMVLMGRSNWWFPRWLEKVVPRVDIEGNEHFERGPAHRGTDPAS